MPLTPVSNPPIPRETVQAGGGVNGFILGIDHPMVDITCHVDDSFIKKYNVPVGGACLAAEEQMPLYEEMSKMPGVEYTLGGTALNTVRVAHWVLGLQKGATGYIGAVGNDKHGRFVEDTTKEEGIVACYMRSELPTAQCASIIKDKERALVTTLDAANVYRLEHLEENIDLVRKAQIIYSTAFFFNCYGGKSIFKAAKETCHTDALFCFNLAAPYLQELHKEKFSKMLAYTDVIFGNEDEAKAYAMCVGLPDDSCKGVAKHLAELPRIKKRQRLAVITRGSQSTVLYRTDGLCMEIPVPKIDPSKICDLNAAGDAFVGGFLAGLAKGENLFDCVDIAHKAAGHIIQHTGCTYEGTFSPPRKVRCRHL